MDPFGSYNPVAGVRHRVLRTVLKKLKRGPLPTLGPGQMQLYSFYSPGLTTGLYDINVDHSIEAASQHKDIHVSQSFLVTAPKFSIDQTLIHSTFPLSGVTAHPNIIPHVVFNDPHLPWQTEINAAHDSDTMRVPWLAVIAFEQSELKMTPEDTVWPQTLQGDPLAQSFTMSNRMTIGTLLQSGLNCVLPNLSQSLSDDQDLDKTVDVIFPKMDLFLALFANSADPPVIDLDRYKYLAHARQVNTEHMADAGVLDEGTFSVVFSHRTGPIFPKDTPATTSKPCVVHVVSLDMVNRMPTAAPAGTTRAALVSLYSWTYDCLPPETINFRDVLTALGRNSEVFGTPPDVYNNIQSDSRLHNRLKDGYTLLRYHVQTGEETVAFMRGPLTPRRVTQSGDLWFDIHSNTGEDLQIIDTTLGIIDITYCAAWQLGKSLAIADQAFCAALLRLRKEVHDGMDASHKEKKLDEHFEPATSKRVINSLSDTFHKMTTVTVDGPDQNRWLRPSLIQSRYQYLKADDDGSNTRNNWFTFVREDLIHRVSKLASAADGTDFSEFKDPTNTDWSLVLNWLMDKIYLEGVPPYYLIPDPTWLPPESIRFFHVDRKWLSALIDGALSIANHLDREDVVRKAIKGQLLKYLNKSLLPPDIKYPPQVPSYGFFVRSVAVAVYPDLVVRAPFTNPNNPGNGAEVPRHENIRKDIMICLLDRTPEKLNHLILSQPPHQQCFAFGKDGQLLDDSVTVQLRKVYSVATDSDMGLLPDASFSRDANGLCDVYDWNWRIIRLDGLAKVILDALKKARETDNKIYDGNETNAALMGIELNDPIYRLTFTGPNAPLFFRTDIQPGAPAQPEIEPVPLPVAEHAVTDTSDDPFSGRFIKITAPKPKREQGPPRRTNQPPPSLLTISRDRSSPASAPPPLAKAALQLPDYSDVEKCSPRFTRVCFTCGHVPSPVPGDDDTKTILIDPSGRTDVIFRFSRNSVDRDSEDYISSIKVIIPLGTTSDCLLSAVPSRSDLRMLSNPRLLPLVSSDDEGVMVELTPKTQTKRTLLSHSLDVSFILNGAVINKDAQGVNVPVYEIYLSKEGNQKVAITQMKPVNVQSS